MFLGALKELAAELVHNLPLLLRDLVLGDWVQEVPGIGKSVGAERAKFWQFEI